MHTSLDWLFLNNDDALQLLSTYQDGRAIGRSACSETTWTSDSSMSCKVQVDASSCTYVCIYVYICTYIHVHGQVTRH